MNAVEFQRRNQDDWNALARLTDKLGQGGPKTLTLEEIADLQRLYLKATSDLAKARTYGLPEGPLRWLNELCTRTHGRIYLRRARRGRAVREVLLQRLPALLWSRRAAVGGCLAALVLGAVVAAVAAARDPSLARVLAPAGGADFGAGSLALLSLRAVGGGMLLGVGSLALLALGGAAAGASLALAPDAGALLQGVAAHAPVGLLAAALAGAVGLEVGWAVVAPGPRPRRDAVAAAARAGGLLLVYAAALLAASLVLDLAVSRSALPAWSKVAAGQVTLVLALGYPLLGRGACAHD
jgi:hypothetical protein